MAFGICFDVEKDHLKADDKFKGSIWEQLEYSKYLCPTCGTHLKESMGELICLNGCHMPTQWQKRFHEDMKKIVSKGNNNI